MLENDFCDDGFTIVKKIKYKKSNNTPKNEKLERDDVIMRSKCILEKYKPYAAYLYGSTARKKNKRESDVDIFIIWKNYTPERETIELLHNELRIEFNRRVDIVNCQYNGKMIKIVSQNSCFIQNIIQDSVSILEPFEKCKIIDDILFDYDCCY